MLTNLKLKVKDIMKRRKTRTKDILSAIAASGRSQVWLAREIRYSPEYFNDIIHNRNGAKLNPYKAAHLARLIGVTPERLTHLFGLPPETAHLGDGGLEPPTSCL